MHWEPDCTVELSAICLVFQVVSSSESKILIFCESCMLENGAACYRFVRGYQWESSLHGFKHKVLPYLTINQLPLGLIFAGLILLKQNNLQNTTNAGCDTALCCSKPNCLRHDTTIYSSSTPIPPPIVCLFTFSQAFLWKGYENNHLLPLSHVSICCSRVFGSVDIIVTCRIRKHEQPVLEKKERL